MKHADVNLFWSNFNPTKNVVDIKVEVQKCNLFFNYEMSVGLVYERDKNEYLLGKKTDVKH